MKIPRAFKVALQPNDRQRTAFNRHAGAARWAFNWGLSTWRRLYGDGKAATPEGKRVGRVTDAMDLHRRLNALKGLSVREGGVPWMREVSKCAPQEALRDLERAYRNTFRRLYEGRKGSFPRYKSKHRNRKAFRLTGSITVEHHRIRLPVIGWVRLAERDYVPIDAPVKSVTVSERAGRWFASVIVGVNQPDAVANPDGPVIGVDLGISALATCSDGAVYENPKALAGELGKIKRLSKRMVRQVKTSNRRGKTKVKLARAHARAANIRTDAIHKMTSEVVKTKRPSVIVVEDLNVRGMVRNRRLARSVSDAAFGEVRRQFTYKYLWGGVGLVVADRFYPSTKRCSRCGAVKSEMGLWERVFRCDACGFTAGRDLNAAVNLRDYPSLGWVRPANGDTASSAGSARGGGVRPRSLRTTRRSSVKREVDGKDASCNFV